MRNLCFLICFLVGLFLFFSPLRDLAKLSFQSELYSYFLLIPVVSIYILVKRRESIFLEISSSIETGLPLVASGVLFYWIGKSRFLELTQNDYLTLATGSFLLCSVGGFIAFYGTQTFRRAMFPLLFLIFAVPIPTPILEALIKVLLTGSANTSYAIFDFLGIPVYRDQFIFELPGITVEVAKQCSGIRSTLALFITSVIAGNLYLRTWRGRIVLSLCIFPITIFKNSLRIVTISLLASYVDPSWVTNSWLHKAGGKPFFILALLFLAPVLWFLRRFEKPHASSEASTPAPLETGGRMG